MHLAIDEEWYWLRELVNLNDPVFESWSQIVVPVLVGIATIVVAGASVSAARKATKIASASEAARIKAEAARQDRDDQRHKEDLAERYEQRLTDALVRLLRSIGEHLGPLVTWSEQTDQVEFRGRRNEHSDLAYPANPAMYDLVARCDEVRLLALGDDAPVATALGHAMVVLENISGRNRRVLLGALVTALREWRSGARTAAETEAYFRAFEESHKPN